MPGVSAPAGLESSEALRDAEIQPIWIRGFIANRAQLRHLLGGDEVSGDLDLLRGLYCLRGASLAREIAGPCAWLLWDGVRRELLAVRDRIGFSGLYFSRDAEGIRIATRPEALFEEAGGVELDARGLAAQVNGSFPAPGKTYFRDIQALRPGELLRVDARGVVERELYWRLGSTRPLRLSDEREYVERYRSCLRQVVEESLPRGAVALTLSSGLDSTSVGAAIRWLDPAREIAAVRWLAPELPTADEGRFSELARRHLGARDLPVRADLHWTLRTSASLRTFPGSPFLNFYTEIWDETFRRVREQGLSCLLSGAGGDHLFGTEVTTYPDDLLTLRWVRLSRELREHAERFGLDPLLLFRRKALAPILRLCFRNWWRRRMHRDVPWLRPPHRGLDDEETISAPGLRWPSCADRLDLLRHPTLAPIAELLGLHGELFGVDFRHPLLDHRLLELAARIPQRQCFRGGLDKIIVRRALRPDLPREIIDLPGKILPNAISERGLREREWATVEALTEKMRAADLGLVEPAVLRRAYREYLEGRSSDAAFWNTLTLEAWLREHFV